MGTEVKMEDELVVDWTTYKGFELSDGRRYTPAYGGIRLQRELIEEGWTPPKENDWTWQGNHAIKVYTRPCREPDI
jgi:hypothetical protein